jgi:site-specific recombinase XerD
MKKRFKITEKQAYKSYLEKQDLAERTIEESLNKYERFLTWSKNHSIDEVAFITRLQGLEYVKFMKETGYRVETQNGVLTSLRKYFDFLISENIITKNPLARLYIRGTQKKVIQNNFSEQELLELYNNYCNYLDFKPRCKEILRQDKAYERYKLIVGLVIFQGLNTGELDKLSVNDIDLRKGTIYIPSNRRSASRVLDLNQVQTIPFYEYLQSLPEGQEKLFALDVQSIFESIIKVLRGINPLLTNAQHIRGSVLINWVKTYGKRKAQYMIGHKFASSTQRFELQDTTELSELIEKTHLFG